MSIIDLHIHSSMSDDGTYSLSDIIRMAKEKHMETIAITDHNSIAGVKEAMILGKEEGICVIPGIEIDTIFEGINFHMTAYRIDIEDEGYQKLEKFYHDHAIQDSWNAVEQFIDYFSLDISKDSLKNIAVRDIIVPEDFADYLLKQESYAEAEFLLPYREKGSRSDNPNVNFYWDYFSQGKIAYVKEEKLPLEEVVELIHKTGGVAVVAHPGVNFKEKDDVLERLLQKVDGIEAFSSYHTEEQCEKYFALAKKYNLKVSCGSDFHGHHKPKIEIGKIPGNQINEKIDCF